MSAAAKLDISPDGLNSAEAAEVLRCTPEKVQELCRAKAIRHRSTWKGHYIIKREWLDEYLEAHTVEPVGEV